jgi:hypothetical protein
VASNYEAICEENRERYGTDIGRIGPMLLADRYDDRTHFIFELLQNAEDALTRRGNWKGSRHVSFTLEPGRLTLSHFGQPFDEADVRGVCGIAESTKDKFSIGRFGIGFKSVYTFTERPEIHSGEEDFAIENYVWPMRVPAVSRLPDETLITLPLRQGDHSAEKEIVDGFKRLGPSALLFLRQIDEINWTTQGGESGGYLRSPAVALGTKVHRVTVIGQESGKPEVDQNWLVFHRDVFSLEHERAGRVEVAFALQDAKDGSGRLEVVPVATSPLVVFFPTAVETNLGFLVQGPFQTTPSRDNIRWDKPWNKYLVEQTAELLVEAVRWLRDQELLDVSALRCMPLKREKFPDGQKFGPVFEAVRQAFWNEPLLPRHEGGYVAGFRSKLARTQELRVLFSPQQVAQLFGTQEAAWLTGDITQDRTAEIRHYVMRELGVTEVTPEVLVPRLTRAFLEVQSDDWVVRLYEFLGGLPALKRRLDSVPLVRLKDGCHVVSHVNGEPQAFLPNNIETEFPTVRNTVCASPDARAFLISLGITEPDPVDDVILNVLQKYRGDSIDVDEDQYVRDIDRILTAFDTDSKTQRAKLLTALRQTTFVMAIDAGSGTTFVDIPGNVYVASDRLKQLFAGVPDVVIVDDTYNCLRGEDVRELLVACGASRYLSPIRTNSNLDSKDRARIRREAGLERASWEHEPLDFTLRGLTELLLHMSSLSLDDAKARAKFLWDSLADLEARGASAFYGTYEWGYSHEAKVARFDAAFVRVLNEAAWVPDPNGELRPPRLVIFDSLGWKPNPFLLTEIEFKPPIIDQLAKEAGIDPAALDLLRKLGITSVAQLTSRLGIGDAPPNVEDKLVDDPEPDTTSARNVYDDARDLYGDNLQDIPPGSPDPDGGDVLAGNTECHGAGNKGTGGAVSGNRSNDGTRSGLGRSGDSAWNEDGAQAGNQGIRSPGQAGGRPFISYVGAHFNEMEVDPDGLDQAVRMRIEKKAIELIIAIEPKLHRTPNGNPGFDLYEADSGGNPIRWVEVKSMTGTLENRPVGLSRTQFDWARERGPRYWLYIVERAMDPAKARVLRIQDPVAKAGTFTFDRGWRQIALIEPAG